MRPIRMLGSLILLALAGGAHAADLYVGGSVTSAVDPAISPEPVDANTGFDVRAGIAVTRLWGAEVAWHDLGAARWCGGCIDAGGEATTKAWSTGLTLGWRFGRVRPFLKAGWFHADSRGEKTTIAGPVLLHRKQNGAFGEAGMRAYLGRHAAVRLAYQRFDFDNGDDGAVSLGAEYRF
jgi:Outer membrane protein beta-barrel domain